MTAPRGKLQALLLVGSLALNLFLGGVFAAQWLRRPSPSPALDPGAFAMPRLQRSLGPDAAPAWTRVWSRHEPAMRSRARDAREARQRATRALSAEPFDESNARAELRDFRAKAAAAQETMHDAVVELARDLTPEQRRKLARAIDNPGPGMKGGGQRRRGPRMGFPSPGEPSGFGLPGPSRMPPPSLPEQPPAPLDSPE